jgi:hypothetical protein
LVDYSHQPYDSDFRRSRVKRNTLEHNASSGKMGHIEDPAHSETKKKVNLQDVSGAERKDEDDTATAILKKKKKPNQLMYV